MNRPRKRGSSPYSDGLPVARRSLQWWLRLRLLLRFLRLAVPAAITIALCAYALTGNSFITTPGENGELSVSLPSSSPAPSSSNVSSPVPSAPSPVPSAPSPVPSAQASAKGSPVTSLWFGDSIVDGCCRTTPASLNMAQTAALSLGWQEPQVRGFPGTGYVRTSTVKGVASPAYAANIGKYLTGARYRVVIVAGGNNDARGAPVSPAAFRAAVRATLQQVRTTLPDAKLVVVGPYSPNGTGYEVQRTIEREEAARVKAMFIDGIAHGWFLDGQSLIAKDGFSPNDAGQAYLGVRMAFELKKLDLS